MIMLPGNFSNVFYVYVGQIVSKPLNWRNPSDSVTCKCHDAILQMDATQSQTFLCYIWHFFPSIQSLMDNNIEIRQRTKQP